MFAPRPCRLFICLISLAVAGCANNSVQETQISAGDARPKTVLVNNLVFSPDVVVVDRDLDARLQRKFGNDMSNDILMSLAARRVNDEIVATIIVLVRAAGLNAQPGDEEKPTDKNGALAISGQLRALDQDKRPRRNPVDFGTGGGIAADMTVSQVSEGPERQLLAFTVQAPSGLQPDAAIMGPIGDAAIAAVLATKSAPDVDLSPNAKALARGLGRAVADKIVAYAVQRGWANKAALPAPAEDAKPVRKKPENLPVAAAKQAGSPTPTNTIPCDAFTKDERGHWYVKGPVTFDIGSAENQTLENLDIPPKFFTIGGVDLYETIQKKCGGSRPTVRSQ